MRANVVLCGVVDSGIFLAAMAGRLFEADEREWTILLVGASLAPGFLLVKYALICWPGGGRVGADLETLGMSTVSKRKTLG